MNASFYFMLLMYVPPTHPNGQTEEKEPGGVTWGEIQERPADLDGFEHKINRGSHMSNTGAVVKLQSNAVRPCFRPLCHTHRDLFWQFGKCTLGLCRALAGIPSARTSGCGIMEKLLYPGNPLWAAATALFYHWWWGLWDNAKLAKH